MSWHEVDMAADPRGGQFAYFQQMVDPFAGVTAAVDITDFLAALDGRPFFLSLLYAVTRAANRVPQLRRRILGRARRGIRLVQPVVHAHEARRRVCLQPDRGRAHLRRLHRRGAAAAGALARPAERSPRTATRWGTSSSRACRGSTICRSSTPSSPQTTAIPASAGAAIPSAAAA